MKKEKVIIFILVCALIAAVIYILLSFNRCGCDTPAITYSGEISTDDEAVDYAGYKPTTRLKNGQKGIVIPGFDSLVFISNQKPQKVNFFNPAENDCYFKMSLTVDNNIVWQSGNVALGKGFYNITLQNTLQKGSYTAYLKIECFKEDLTRLNSADVQIKLEVTNYKKSRGK